MWGAGQLVRWLRYRCDQPCCGRLFSLATVFVVARKALKAAIQGFLVLLVWTACVDCLCGLLLGLVLKCCDDAGTDKQGSFEH